MGFEKKKTQFMKNNSQVVGGKWAFKKNLKSNYQVVGGKWAFF